MRIGVIGAGDFGELHLKILKEHPDAEIAYICVRNLERGRAKTEKYGGVLTNRYEDMLEDDTVEAVSVLTPEQVHFEQVMKALEHGKHVLVEKPVTMNPEEAEILAAKAEKKGLIVMPGHTCRFLASFAKARGYLKELQREPVSIHARRNIPRERLALHNRVHPVLMALSHDIDLVLSYVESKPTRVMAMERKTDSSLENPDIFWGLVEFENGCIAALETLWVLPTSARYVDSAMEIATTQEVLHVSYPSAGFWVDDAAGFLFPDPALTDVVNGEQAGALKDEIHYFLKCVRARVTPEVVTLNDAANGLRIAQALIRSAGEKKEIRFEDGRPLS